MLATFGEVKSSGVVDIADVSPNSDEFRQIVNKGTRRLLRRGDWSGTIVPIFVCIKRGCIVWPRYVGAIRKLNFCRSWGIEVKNVWWDFLPYTRERWNTNAWWGWMGMQARAVTQGKTATFDDIMGDGRKVRAYISTPLDNNRTIKIFGEDTNGQPLMTQGVGGWTDGVTLTLTASSYAETPMQVRRIDRIIKQQTQGPVRLYAYNIADAVLEDIGFYEPSETNPAYVRQRINTNCCSDCSTSRGVIALVKLAYVPVVTDTDLVLIENLDALELIVQCIRCEQASDFETAKRYEMDAVRELNLQLQDDNPDDQVSVDFGELNGAPWLGAQRCF